MCRHNTSLTIAGLNTTAATLLIDIIIDFTIRPHGNVPAQDIAEEVSRKLI